MVGKLAVLVLLVALCHAKPNLSEKRLADAKHHAFMKRQSLGTGADEALTNEVDPNQSGDGDSVESVESVESVDESVESVESVDESVEQEYENQTLCDDEHNPCGGWGDNHCKQIGPIAVRCGPNPPESCELECVNGGICVIDRCSNQRCQCPIEYTGRFCEETYDPCRHVNCRNGECQAVDPPAPPPPPPGVTNWRPSPYHMRQYGRCVCDEGYTGYRCESYMAPPLDEAFTMSVGETRNIVYPTPDMDEDFYANNVVATWTINCNTNASVEYVVTANTVDTESCCDHIRIRGNSEQPNNNFQYGGSSHNRFSGCITPGQQMTTVVDQGLVVSFRTDMSVVYAGFNISVSIIPASDDPCADDPCVNGNTCEQDDDGNAYCAPREESNFRYRCDDPHPVPFPGPPTGTF